MIKSDQSELSASGSIPCGHFIEQRDDKNIWTSAALCSPFTHRHTGNVLYRSRSLKVRDDATRCNANFLRAQDKSRTFVRTKEDIRPLCLHVPVNSNRGEIITSCYSMAGFVFKL